MSKRAERHAAKIAGEKFYFTGKPCKQGHIGKRHTGEGKCYQCMRISGKKTHDKWYERTRKTRLEKSRAWRLLNKNKMAALCADWYKKNKARHRRVSVEWEKNNWNSRLVYFHTYRKNNKSIFIARGFLKRCLASAKISRSNRTFTMLGYSSYEFMEHLGRYFTPEMTWDNHGSVWHVDHVIPIAEMLRLGITDLKKINALSNLRPMRAVENMSKGDRFALVMQ